MLFARDFRAWAREILKGNWAIAILVGLVGSLLGGGLDLVSGLNGGTNLDVQASAEAADYAMQIGPYSIAPNNPGLLDFIPRELWAMLVTITLVSTLLALIIGGAVTLGMSSYHLNLITVGRAAELPEEYNTFQEAEAAVLELFQLMGCTRIY